MSSLDELRELTRRLRAECPWDREQTARTIVPHTVEEAYEVADAALADDPAKLHDELGDLLFQVYFLSLLLEEKGDGDLDSVARVGARQARSTPPARVRRGGGPHGRPRPRALGGNQDRAGGAQRRLPRHPRVAAGAPPCAKDATAGRRCRVRLAGPRRPGGQGARGARRAARRDRPRRAPGSRDRA